MKNSISKIIIGVIVLIIGIGAFIGYNYMVKKEQSYSKIVHYYTTVDGGQELEKVSSDIIEETTNTSRIFDKEPTVAVSNSNTEPGTTIYKAFNVLEDETLELSEFTLNNGIYLKKIISYDEYLKYKSMWNGIRELTQEDFINYYLVILVDTNANENRTYTLKNLLIEDECLNLNIAFRDSSNSQESIASGIAIIIANRTDFEQDKISIFNRIDKKETQ